VWLLTAYGRSQFSSKWGSIFNMIHSSASFCKAFNRQIRGLDRFSKRIEMVIKFSGHAVQA
jgi:hypothetical protein